eukprot:g6378.t1
MEFSARVKLRQALLKAQSSDHLTSKEKALIKAACADEEAAVPFAAVRALRKHLRGERKRGGGGGSGDGGDGAFLQDVMAGSALHFPKEADEDSDYMKKRREYLKLKQKRWEYKEMTKSVAPDIHMQGLTPKDGSVSMVKGAVGLHLIFAMGGGFVVLYLVFRQAYPAGSTVPVMFGLMGAVGMMAVEITLFIIRDNRETEMRRKDKLQKERAALGGEVNASDAAVAQSLEKRAAM